MHRREFIQKILHSAAAAIAGPRLLEAPLSGAPQNLRPYGTDRLENTDTFELTNSLARQIKLAGFDLPSRYLPFPPNDTRHATGYCTTDAIVGLSPANAVAKLERFRAFFNDIYPGDHACPSSPHSFMTAYIVKVALHEMTHYCCFKRPALVNRPFNKINGLPPDSDPVDFINELRSELKRHSQRSPMSSVSGAAERQILKDMLTLAEGTYYAMWEQIADASSIFYGLSDYQDTASTLRFERMLSDIRRAFFSQKDHDTSSCLDAAVASFSRRAADERRGLMIYDTAKWASEIVATLP